MYQLIFMSQAQKDAKRLASSGLKPKVLKLLSLIEQNPLQYPPEYEILKGDLQGLILCTGQNPGNTYYTRVLGDQPQMLSLQGFGAMLITFLSGT